MKTPLSLRPDIRTMEAYAAHNPVARAIIDAWQFRYPVTRVTRKELQGSEGVFSS